MLYVSYYNYTNVNHNVKFDSKFALVIIMLPTVVYIIWCIILFCVVIRSACVCVQLYNNNLQTQCNLLYIHIIYRLKP